LPYPEKDRIEAKQTDQHKNDNAPFANPQWVFVIERKKNIRGIFMNPHVKEYVRCPSNETTEINRLETIVHFFGIKPEKPVNTKDGFVEPSLSHINN